MSVLLICSLSLAVGGGTVFAQAPSTPIAATQPASQPDAGPPVPDPAVPPPAKPKPDVLVFMNGDRLTGKLERAVGANVVFNSDMAGELTIPFSKVRELQSGSEFVALRKGKAGETKVAGTGDVSFAEGTVTLKKGTAPAQTLPESELGFLIDVPSYSREVDHRASLRQGWTGFRDRGTYSRPRDRE